MGELSDRLKASLAGRYAIEREIGAGGMATVYLARDLKHSRKVAVKVLRPELAAVLGTERFLAEIQVTASLQHPHLLPLFDSGEADGHLFYVMPFVEGESLRARLDRERQLPVEEALRLTAAVASALDYAHRQGVVHRDLKPENVLLHDGQPLVADFGIALAISKAGGARVTQTGISLGTPAYMSPEQATADRVIDARADIYSLAAVTYEMLAGDPPHKASTAQATIAKLLTERPQSVRRSRPSVPESVDEALLKALEKLPADRFVSAEEFVRALGSPAASGSVRARSMSAVVRSTSRLWKPMAIGASALAVMAIALALRPRAAPAVPSSLSEVTFADSLTVTLATNSPNVELSRDGSAVAMLANAYGANSGLYVRPLGSLEARLIQPGETWEPRFSPDGRSIAFLNWNGQGGLWRVGLAGGPPVKLMDSVTVWGLSWGDGDQIAFTRRGGVWLVPGLGGTPRLVAAPDSARGHLFYRWPHILPGGRACLIVLWKRGDDVESAELGVVRFDTGEVIELDIPGTSPRYAANGRIVFARPDGVLSAARFSLRDLEVVGPVVTLPQTVRVMAPGGAEFALSENGMLAYRTGEGTTSRLVVSGRDGSGTTLPIEPRAFVHPRFSPDGRRLAVGIVEGSRSDILIYDLASSNTSRLTQGGASSRPEWSPDSRRVAFVEGSSDLESSVLWQPWDGSTRPEPFPGGDAPSAAVGMDPGGRFVTISRWTPDRSATMAWNIWITRPDSAGSSTLLVEHARAHSISPDGNLIAYVTTAGDPTPNAVFVGPITGPAERRQVSDPGGYSPRWSPDGRELFYIQAPGRMMSARIQLQPELEVLPPDTLFVAPLSYVRSRESRFDVHPSGEGFVMTQPTNVGAPRLLLRTGWLDEVAQATAAAGGATR